jgi:hypothetical protein
MDGKTSLVISIILLGIIVLPVAVVPLVHAQEGEVTINPTADTFVDSVNDKTNHGEMQYMLVSRQTESMEDRIWLKFNLSSVPDGAIVDMATLRLYCINSGDPTYNVYAHSSSNISWTELGITWANMPSYNTTSMDMKQVATTYRWYNWSVTYAVQNAVDGIHGGPDAVTIVLLETTVRGYNVVTFNSKEGPTYSFPELTVHWSGIVPEFPSFLVLPLFMMTTLMTIIVLKRRHRVQFV